MNAEKSLTPHQCKVLDVMARTGCAKSAAKELGVQHKVVNQTVRRAMRTLNARTALLAVLAWDRTQRVQA